ncbi:MAG: hypothetical protein U0893_27265 [Chloroflexota bacterium]
MSDAAESAARALMETGRGLAQAGNLEAALAVFRQAHLLAPPGSSLQLALEHAIERASGGKPPQQGTAPRTSPPMPPTKPLSPHSSGQGPTSGPPTPPTVAHPQTGVFVTMPTQSATGPSSTQMMPPRPRPTSTLPVGWPPAPGQTVPPTQQVYPSARAWKPEMSAPSRSRLLLSLIGVTVAAGVVLFAVTRLFSADLNRLADLLLLGGALVFQPIRNAVLATILGLVQVWRLRDRLPGDHRLHFVLYATLGGLVGGFVGGLFGDQSIKPSNALVAATIGVTIGGIAGGLSAFLQGRQLPDFRRGARWLLFNLLSWAILWGSGYVLGALFGDTAGVAAASGFIVLGTGLALTGFLYLSPELEY